jgi:hypothetical protein
VQHSLKINSLEDSDHWIHTAGSVSIVDREKPIAQEMTRLVGAAFGRASMKHGPLSEKCPLVGLVIPAGEFGYGVLRAWFREGLFSKPRSPLSSFAFGMARVQSAREKFIRIIFDRNTREIYCEFDKSRPDFLSCASVDADGPSEMEIDACSTLAAMKEN